MTEIIFIKDTKAGYKKGDIVKLGDSDAKEIISKGLAVYNNKQKKEQIIFSKNFQNNKKNDITELESNNAKELYDLGIIKYHIKEEEQYKIIKEKVLEIIRFDIITIDKEIDDFSKKYEIKKIVIKKVLSDEKKNIKEKLKEQERNKKDFNKSEKEKEKDEQRQRIQSEKDMDKLKLEELQEGWRTCSDELFVELIDKDFKKAQHYFTQRLMHDHHFKVFDDNEDILVYCNEGEKEGEYLQDGDKIVQTMCESRLGEKATIVVVREVISKIQRTEKLKISRESIFNNDKDTIAVKNGILNMKTRELSNFTPDKVFLSKSNAKFIPEVEPKMWLNFLNTSLPDKEDEKKTIQEMSGYTLSNDNSRQKGFISYGAGATGQSTMQEVLAFLIGEENITNLSIQDIEHDAFAPAMLFGKKANMNPDLPKKALGESSRIKKIIRGEKLYVQKKGKDGYSMRPTVKLWNGCNQIPTTADQSDGFFRSWIVVMFEEQFLEGDPRRIEDLANKISSSEEEMSGILNWCVDGYNRLEENNRFSKCFTIQEVKDFWLENSDTVSSFYKKVIKMESTGKILKQHVYDNYVEYCEKMNKPAEEQNIFFGKLKNVCEYKEYTPPVSSQDRRRRLIGISLLPLDLINNGKKVIKTQVTQVSLDQRPIREEKKSK